MADKAQADIGLLQRFRDVAEVFALQLDGLPMKYAGAKRYPAVAAEYRRLMVRGATIKNAIRRITGGIDDVSTWFSDLFSRSELNSMGFWPVIAASVAAVAIAMAAIRKWSRDVYLTDRAYEEARRLEGAGLSPREAASLARGQTPGVLAEIAREVITPLTIGAVSLIAFWMVFKNGKK